MMRPHLRYLSYVLRHKWFVFLAGTKTGVPLWRLVIHDWDKFLPRMWVPYVNHFYRNKSVDPRSNIGYRHDPSKASVAMNAALESHVNRHGHHWQFWLHSSGAPHDMPDVYVREMLADWMGAGKAQSVGWDVRPWYAKNRDTLTLHPITRRYLESLIEQQYQGPLQPEAVSW